MNFKISADEYTLAGRIAQRAVGIAEAQQPHLKRNRLNELRRTFFMDITAVHKNLFRLRLQELLDSDNFNFTHDVFGIYQHLNRETGKLENCFVPRFALTKSRRCSNGH